MARTKQTARKKTPGITAPSERTNQINDGSPQQNKLPTSTSGVNTSVSMDNNNNTAKQHPPPTPSTTTAPTNLIPNTNMIANTNNTLQQKQLSSHAPTLTTTEVDSAPSKMNLDDFKMDIDNLVGLGDEIPNVLEGMEGEPNVAAIAINESTQPSAGKRQKTTHTPTPQETPAAHGGLISKEELRLTDIICGKGSSNNNNPGNKNYRELIRSHQQEYYAAEKGDKLNISERIVKQIKDNGGRFLTGDTGQDNMLAEISEKKAVAKVSQALRDTKDRNVKKQSARKESSNQDVRGANSTSPPPLPTITKKVSVGIILGGDYKPSGIVARKNGNDIIITEVFPFCCALVGGGYTQQDLVGAMVTHIDGEPISANPLNINYLMNVFRGDGKGGVVVQTEVRVTLSSKAAVATPSTIISGTQKKKTKAKKDPNKPKGFKNALFCMADARPIVKAANPDADSGEMNKLLSQHWNGLSAEDRDPYEKMADVDKERYKREMAEYNSTPTTSSVTSTTKAEQELLARQLVVQQQAQQELLARQSLVVQQMAQQELRRRQSLVVQQEEERQRDQVEQEPLSSNHIPNPKEAAATTSAFGFEGVVPTSLPPSSKVAATTSVEHLKANDMSEGAKPTSLPPSSKVAATTSVEHLKANDTSEGAVPTSLPPSSKASSSTAADTPATKTHDNEMTLTRMVSNDSPPPGATTEVEDPLLSRFASNVGTMQKQVLDSREQEMIRVVKQMDGVMENSSQENVDGIIQYFDILSREIKGGCPQALLAEKSRLQDSVSGLQKTLTTTAVVATLDDKTKSGLENALEATETELKKVNADIARTKVEQDRLLDLLKAKAMELYDARKAEFMAEDGIELSKEYADATRLRLKNHVYENSSE